MVWLCELGGVATAFRVVDDGSLADVDDVEFALPEDAVVRVAHPVRLGAQLGAWGEMFADYEILQPFPQLGRPVYALTDAERAGVVLSRFDGISVPAVEARALLEREWQPGGFLERHFVRPTPDGRWLVLAVDPEPALTPGGGVERLRLGSVTLEADPDVTSRDKTARRSLGLDGLDPVFASELLHDLYRLSDR